jgi:hypothetical protein
MKALRKLAPLLLTALLGDCATGPDSPDVPGSGVTEPGIKTLQEILPGAYSNFAQMHGQHADVAVTDIRIRQLQTIGEPVFLFEKELRGQDTYSHDLYWLKLNRKTRHAELHFTRLHDDELSLPIQDILPIAWQRVLPGCVIPLDRNGDRFTGQTNPATCVIEHPLQGETRLTRSLAIGRDTMTIKTGVQGAGIREAGDDTLLELQKHRVFIGWASIRIAKGQQQDEPVAWQLSQVFSTRDDGRLNHLYDQQMARLDYGLQLTRLQRFDGEPPYYQLSIISLETGQTQAYQWFQPESEHLNLNLDWFQASLEPISTADPQP